MRLRNASRALHPPFTDFPIALWATSLLFDLGSIWIGNAMVKAAFFNMATGCVFALFAAVTGVADYNKVHEDHPARKLGIIHALLNVVALTLFSVNLWLRTSELGAARISGGPVIVSGFALAFMAVAAWVGGKMVFEYGTNVASLTRGGETVGTPLGPLRPRTPVKP